MTLPSTASRPVDPSEAEPHDLSEIAASDFASEVALLTGGNDKHYAVALAAGLVRQGVRVDFVASSDLDCAEVHVPGIRFLNLRGDQREDVALIRKVVRILTYYGRLVVYAATCRPKVLHILWNN